MKRLMCVLMLMGVASGCVSFPGAATPVDGGDPFAHSVRFQDLADSQGRATVSAAESAKHLGEMRTTDSKHLEATQATNELLSQLLEQQKILAGQQCDLLKEVQELKRARTPESPEPTRAKSSPSVFDLPPLWIPEENGTPTVSDVPTDTTITIGKETTLLADFIARWYKGPWDGDPEACLIRFGIDADFLDSLPQETINKLHGAIHEHSQQSAPQKPTPQKPQPRPSNPPAVAQQTNCPGGVCPAPMQTQQMNRPVYLKPARRSYGVLGIFGRRR